MARDQLAVRSAEGSKLIRSVAGPKELLFDLSKDPDRVSAAFDAMLNQPFDLGQPGSGQVGGETSPYGMKLGATYPKPDLDQLITAATTASSAWRKASAACAPMTPH